VYWGFANEILLIRRTESPRTRVPFVRSSLRLVFHVPFGVASYGFGTRAAPRNRGAHIVIEDMSSASHVPPIAWSRENTHPPSFRNGITTACPPGRAAGHLMVSHLFPSKSGDPQCLAHKTTEISCHFPLASSKVPPRDALGQTDCGTSRSRIGSEEIGSKDRKCELVSGSPFVPNSLTPCLFRRAYRTPA